MLSRRKFLISSALSAVSVPALFNWKPKSAAASSVATVEPRSAAPKSVDHVVSDAEDVFRRNMAQKMQIYERWAGTGLVSGLPQPFAVELACCLENQRIMQEAFPDSPEMLQARRLLIPIVTRVNRRCVTKDLVSFQTLLGPCGNVFYRDAAGRLEYDEIFARTRKQKCVWSYDAVTDLKFVHGLDAEAELCAVLAEELSLEQDREVLCDLRLNAKRHKCHTSPREYHKFVNDMFGRIAKDCGRPNDPEANWLVTSPEVMSYITTHDPTYRPPKDDGGFIGSFGIQREGRTKTCALYKDPLFPVNQMLLGCKHGQYGAGYIYAPYIPENITPTIIDPESFCPRRGLLTRRAKRLVDAKMYATVTCTQMDI